MKKLNLEQMEVTNAGSWIGDVVGCWDDMYTGRGWASFGLIVCAVAVPETSLLVLAGCVAEVNLNS